MDAASQHTTKGGFSKKTTTTHDQLQSTAAISEARTSTLNAGKDLTIIATDGSITSQGAQISAEGNAMLLAKDSIRFDVAHTTESKSQDSQTSGFSFDNRTAMQAGTLHNKSNGNGATDTVTGTKLSVGGSTMMATQTGDITLTGADVASAGKLSINAARDLTITSAQDTVHNANQSDNKAVGKVVISDTERFAGYHNEKHLDNGSQVTQVASNVGSLTGDVVLSAGGKYTQASSNVLAKNDVNITAKTIDITALDNTGSNQSANSDLKIGAFARISSPLIDLVNNVDAARKSDGRLKAMQGMAAAANGYQAATSMSSGILVKGEAGLGFANSSNSSNSNGSTAVGSTIHGDGNVNLTATGGDIHATGATLGAGKTLNLDAAQNIVLDASQSTIHSDGKNHSAGAEVGVGFQVGAQTGVYVYGTANVGNGHNNSDATINNNTQLKADTLNLHSKGDTTLKGATATANTINTDVGGKLAIESLQDASHEASSQTGVGVRVQWGLGAWQVSGNVSQQKSNGSSTAVGQQSGLFAGDGGYHVKADTVDLKGGAIASTNTTTSELTTNKLTTANLENKMKYSASSVSLAGGISGDSDFGKKSEPSALQAQDKPYPQETQAQDKGGAQAQTTPGSSPTQLFGAPKSGNVTPGLPMVKKGSDSSTTYATVTNGKITIGGVTTNSVKDLGINTDVSKANVALDKLPDMQKLVKEQQAMSAAAGTVIATVKQVSADITNDARKAEAKAQDTLKNPDSTEEQIAEANRKIEEAQKVQKEWGVGGDKSRALNVVTGILVGGVAGQGGTQIAANAAAPYAAAEIGDHFKKEGNENQALQDLSHAVLGAALAYANNGSAIGGALAGGGGELAAQVLAKELYPQAVDANGILQRDKLTPEQANNISSLSSAIGALLSGAAGDGVRDAAIGGQVATNAVENNYLNHKRPDPMRLSEKERYEAAAAACNSGDRDACKRRDDLALTSRRRDDRLQNACLTGSEEQCRAYAGDASAMGNRVSGSYGGVVYAFSPEKGAIQSLTPSMISPVTRPESFHDSLSKSTAEGLLLFGGDAGALVPAKFATAAGKYSSAVADAVIGEQRMARMALGRELRAGLLADVPAEASIFEAKAGTVVTMDMTTPSVTLKPSLTKIPAVSNYSAPTTIEPIASAANAKRVVPAEITYDFGSISSSSGAVDSISLTGALINPQGENATGRISQIAANEGKAGNVVDGPSTGSGIVGKVNVPANESNFGKEAAGTVDNASPAHNPLLADSIPRNGERLILDQGRTQTCGHNSCGMALDTMGRPVDVEALIKKIPPTERGIYSSDVADLLKSEGVGANFWGRRNVSDLSRYTSDGTPVIVRIVDNTGGTDFSHFVVVDGVTTKSGRPVVAIRDPHGSQYYSPVDTFQKNFTGEVIVPKKPK